MFVPNIGMAALFLGHKTQQQIYDIEFIMILTILGMTICEGLSLEMLLHQFTFIELYRFVQNHLCDSADIVIGLFVVG